MKSSVYGKPRNEANGLPPRTRGEFEGSNMGNEFTLIPDDMISQYGLTAAAVWGVMHRHCQMRNRVCYASIGTLSKLIGVSRPTFHKHLTKLLVAGELVDETPDRQGRPHKYHTVVHIGAVYVDDSPELLDGPVQKPYASLEEPVMSVDTGVKKLYTPVKKLYTPVKKLYTRITTKETNKETNEEADSSSLVIGDLFRLLESAGVVLTQHSVEQYKVLFEEATPQEVCDAIEHAKRTVVRLNPGWLRAVILRCQRQHCKPGEWPDQEARGEDDDEDETRAPPMPRAYVHPFTGKVVEVGESSEEPGRPTAE